MTICPIAIVVGCKKCLAFTICPAKRLLGDMPLVPPPAPAVKAKASARPATKAAATPRTAAPKSASKRKSPAPAKR